MTAYTITTTQNMTQLTAKSGNDTYNINGGELIINSDTRYGPNTSTTTGPTGNIYVSATLGGALTIEGFSVRLIPYSAGTGNVPASGTTLTQGGVSCELLCAMSLKTGGTVTAAGSPLPASGWLKVRTVVGGVFSVGAFTSGIAATVTAPDETGWVVLAGVRDKVFSIPRLGYMTVDGRMFTVGVTSGVRGQTIQLPHYTVDQVTAYPGVEIETAPGSGVYKFWPNAASKFTSVDASTDTRSKFVGITNDGIVTIGMGRDAISAGYLPVSGCNVRIPNIILQTTEATNFNISMPPSTTMGVRFEALFSGAGRLTHSCSTGAWYWNMVQPYSIYIRDLHSCDQIVIQEVATQANIDRLHVGLSNSITTAISILFQQCYAGGVVGEMSGLRAEAVSTSGYAISLTNLYGVWTFQNIRVGQPSIAAAISGAIIFNTCDDVTVEYVESFTKRLLVSACNRIKIKRHIYADNCIGTTPTTVATHAVECISAADVEVTNIENWAGVANCHPYNGLIYLNTVKRGNLRYCGTNTTPYDAGTVNVMGYIVSDGGNNDGCKVQRNWTTGLRLGIASSTNTTNRFRLENCYTTDPSKTVGPQQNNSVNRGNKWMAGTVPTSYTAVYGTHFWDAFTSDTTTRAAIAFAEKTASSSSAYSVTGGTPVFSAQGSIVMRAVGDQLTWSWSYRIIGWTGLTTMTVAGTNTGNHLYEYQLDKGSGFSGTWKTLSNTNLAAETGIDPTIGFIPMIRITATVASSTNKLDSISFNGTTTLAIQNLAFYPLDTYSLTLSGLQVGSEVRAYTGTGPTDAVLVGGGEESLGSLSFFHNVNGQSGYIQIFHLEYQPVFFYVDYIAFDKEYLIRQIPDRQYARGTSYLPT